MTDTTNPLQSMPHTPDLTLVIGASGKTGRRVAERLEADGRPVRRGSRSGNPAFDWDHQETWPAALAGVQQVYITYQPDLAVPQAPVHLTAFVEQARLAGVEKLVLLSGRGEPAAQACEEIVQASGLRWTVVRASWFAQNFSEGVLLDAVLSGTLALPASQTKEPFIDIDDIADVATWALTAPESDGEVFEVTGPELLSFDDVVGHIARANQRPMRFERISPEAYQEGLRGAGVPEDFAGFLTWLVTETLDGRNAYVTDGVQRALGRPPRSFADYAARTAETGIWEVA